MRKILAVSTVHERPDLVLSQIENYRAAFGGNLFQVVHVNADCAEVFFRHARHLGVDFSGMNDVHVYSRYRTKWAGIFHAQLFSVFEASKIGVLFDRVLFHTAADLMCKSNADVHLRSYDVGYSVPVLSGGGDFWADKIGKNAKLHELISEFAAPGILRARVEGAFLASDIFYEAIYPLLLKYDLSCVDGLPNYPMEEVDMVAAVEFFCANNAIRRTRNMIHTSENELQICEDADIDWCLEQSDVFGCKRFRQDVFDPVRLRVKALLTQD